ncbi:MAG: hypothetical protein IJ659_04080 [Alloprevotella sp.]|nr:hypothetical protein [Alloprevotella sp.]
MYKQLLKFKTLLLVCLLAMVGTNAFAAEEVYKTALFGSSYNSTSVSSYTATWTAANGNFTVSLANFNNNNNSWNYVKCGSKNAASVATITTNNAIDKAITKVNVTIDAVTANNVNSIKLYTSNNNSTWTEAGSYTVETGTKSVALLSPTANLYYKIEFDCKKSSNGVVQVSKVEYYYNSVAASTTTTIKATGITNKDLYTDTKAGSLSATVVDEDNNAVEGATVTWSGNNNTVATIDASTGAVTLVAAGKVTFTASYAGVKDKYQASSATYEMTVTSSAPYAQPTEFDIDLNNSLFGTTYSGSASGITDDKPVSGSKENVVVTYAGSGSHYINDSQIRFYPNNKLTFEAPSGYNITKIVFTADGTWAATISADNGTYTSTTKTWTGEATTVLFTGSGSSRCDMSKVAITLSLPDERTTTNVTIDASGITNTNVYTGTAAGQLVATVKAGETTLEGASVTWKGDNSSVATIAADGTVTLVGAGNVTFTATYAGDESNYKGSNAEYALTVVNEDPNVPGASAENPYTVAQAIAATPASGTSANVYIRGIVSSFYNSNSSITDDATYHRYYISDDGTTTDQLMVFNGKGLNNVAFSNTDDLELGDEVIIYGGLTTYNSTKEIAADNHIVSLTRKEAATITVTGGTEFTIDRTQNEEELTLTATANSGATVVFTLDSENTTLTEGSDFDFNNGDLLFYTTKGGIITVKANAPAAGNYKAAEEVTITITVVGEKEAPVIAVNSTETVAYGSTFTVDDSMIEGGAITVTSSNTAVATVSSLTITPVAVGTTTITVATAENDTYKAGSETFTLTVTAPEGGTEAPVGIPASAIFTETFDQCDGTGGNDDKWSGSIATGTPTYDNTGWSLSGGKANKCVKLNKGATLISPDINVQGATSLELTFKVAGWGTEEGDLSISLDDEDAMLSSDAEAFTGSTWSNHTVNISSISGSTIQITFTAPSGKRCFIDEVILTKPATTTTITAKLNGSGYATFCSEYPLDFTDATDHSAWLITGVSNNTITFAKITGSIKGGQGILLKGTANETVTLASADSENTLSGNKLVGTLAPTYVAAEQYYGLSGANFVKVNAGTVKAGKALLPASALTSSGDIRAYTFVFVDPTTGITETQNVSAEEFGTIFNLAGQRISQPQKGVNIINGKKVLVK